MSLGAPTVNRLKAEMQQLYEMYNDVRDDLIKKRNKANKFECLHCHELPGVENFENRVLKINELASGLKSGDFFYGQRLDTVNLNECNSIYTLIDKTGATFRSNYKQVRKILYPKQDQTDYENMKQGLLICACYTIAVAIISSLVTYFFMRRHSGV